MNPAIVVQALLDLWDDLPELFGPAWAEIYPQIDENIDRLTKAETLPQQTHLVTELLLLFGRYPVATQRLRRSIQLSEQNLTRLYGRESIDNIPITELHDVVSRLEEHVNPPLEIRYTDITAPIRLPLGQRGVITVGLRCAIVPESVVAQPLRVSPKSIVEVYLHTGTDEVSVDEAVHHLQVEPGRDTAPVVFYIRGLQLGTTTLTLQFAQSGVLVGTIQFVVAIVSETLSEEFLQNLSATLGLGNSYAPPPDLDLRVLTQQRDGGIVLQYVLH